MGKKDKANVEKKDVVLEEAKDMGTAVVVAGGKEIATAFFPDLFNDIDFNGLNNAIDKIGDSSHELSIEEKEMGVQIVEQWNNDVVTRLRAKRYEMDTLIKFFNPMDSNTNLGHLNLIDFGGELAEKTVTKSEFGKVLSLEDELRNHELTRPEKPIKEETTTYEEDLRNKSKYEGDLAVWDLKRQRLQRQLNVSVGEWKRALNETQPIKELLTDARKYVRGAGKMESDAHNKGQMAKLSISISSKNARDAMKELMKFSESI